MKDIIPNRLLEEGVTYWEGQELNNCYELRVRIKVNGKILGVRRILDRFELENSIVDIFVYTITRMELDLKTQMP